MNSYLLAAKRIVPVALFALLPTLMVLEFMVVAVRPGPHHMVDFHTFWVAAHNYAHHRNPYPSSHELALGAAGRARTGYYFYPPVFAAIITPLAWLSFTAAAMVFAVLLLAAVMAALWLLDIRDWRVYGVVVASPAILTGITIGTISPFLLLLGACAWRWRDRKIIVAIAVGAAVTAKLFLWPLLLWLWFTHRRPSTIIAAALGVVASLVAWAWIGFAGLSTYPSMLRSVRLEGDRGYSPGWLIGSDGVWLIAVVGALFVVWLGRRQRDRECFIAAVVVALLASPVLWLHYFSLLPLVLVQHRRLNWRWLVPLALWATPSQLAFGDTWRIALAMLVIAAISIPAGAGLQTTSAIRRGLSTG